MNKSIPLIPKFNPLWAEQGLVFEPANLEQGYSSGTPVYADNQNWVINDMQSKFNMFGDVLRDYKNKRLIEQEAKTKAFLKSHIGRVWFNFSTKHQGVKLVNDGMFIKLFVDDTVYQTADYPDLQQFLRITTSTFKLTDFIHCTNSGTVLINITNGMRDKQQGTFTAGTLLKHFHGMEHDHDASHEHGMDPDMPTDGSGSGTGSKAGSNRNGKNPRTNDFIGNTGQSSKTNTDNTGIGTNLIDNTCLGLYIIAKLVEQPNQVIPAIDKFNPLWAENGSKAPPLSIVKGYFTRTLVKAENHNFVYNQLQNYYNQFVDNITDLQQRTLSRNNVLQAYLNAKVGDAHFCFNDKYRTTDKIENDYFTLLAVNTSTANYNKSNYPQFADNWNISATSFNFSNLFNLSTAVANTNFLALGVKLNQNIRSYEIGNILSHFHNMAHTHTFNHSHGLSKYNQWVDSGGTQPFYSVGKLGLLAPITPKETLEFKGNTAGSSLKVTQNNTTLYPNANLADSLVSKLFICVQAKVLVIKNDNIYSIEKFNPLFAESGDKVAFDNVAQGFISHTPINADEQNNIVNTVQSKFNTLSDTFLGFANIKDPLENLKQSFVGVEILLNYNIDINSRVYNDGVFTWLLVDNVVNQTNLYPKLAQELGITENTFILNNYIKAIPRAEVQGNNISLVYDITTTAGVKLGSFIAGQVKAHGHGMDHYHSIKNHSHGIPNDLGWFSFQTHFPETVSGYGNAGRGDGKTDRFNGKTGKSSIAITGIGGNSDYNTGNNINFKLYLCAGVA